MSRRWFRRAAALFTFLVLGGWLAVLASPAASASTSVQASLTYGCSNGGWVEVTLTPRASDGPQTFQLGLADPSTSGVQDAYPNGGGPSVVTTYGDPVTVRLAGSVSDSDHVFIQRTYRPSNTILKLDLPGRCQSVAPTSYGLKAPTITLSRTSCTNSETHVRVSVQNRSDLSGDAQDAGVSAIQYNVLLVRQSDGQLMTSGENLSFDDVGEQQAVDLVAPTDGANTNYQVRVIGVDGVERSRAFTAGCSTTPPTTTPPTTTPPTSKPPTSTPSTPKPPVSTPPTTKPPVSTPPTSNPPVIVVPHNTPGTGAGSTASSASAAPTAAGSSSDSNGSSSSGTGSSPAPTPSSSFGLNPGLGFGGASPSRTPQHSASPSPSASAEPTPSPSGSRSLDRYTLAEPMAGSHSLLSFQSDAALIVAVDAIAIGALIGATVWRTSRR